MVAGVGVSGYFNNTASAIITSIGPSEVISLKDGEEITYTPAAIDGYQYAGCVKLVNGVPVPMTPDNSPAPSNPSTPPVIHRLHRLRLLFRAPPLITALLAWLLRMILLQSARLTLAIPARQVSNGIQLGFTSGANPTLSQANTL